MKKVFAIMALAAISLSGFAGNDDVNPDENPLSHAYELEEVSIVSTLKERGLLRDQPSSGSMITASQIEEQGINSLKGVSNLVPNFYMPDYGSRLTSAIYIRGVGSRIGTPAIGLYVDNVPYYDKTAFDFSFLDVERVDILRGPQATLYGRNTMGGLVRVFTKNPFDYQGTDVDLGFTTKDSRHRASFSHFSCPTDKFAFSLGGFYEGNDGFFRNDFTGKKVDRLSSFGGKFRGIYNPIGRLSLDANLGYEYSDEGAYPYYYVDGDEYEDLKGQISSNLEGKYRRGMLNASLNAEYWIHGNLSFNSVTAYQNINDRMFMDQDFLATDIYSLQQKQRINTLSEELLLKNHNNYKWQWITGASFFHQWLNTKAPVNFREDGVAWLNDVINTNANANMPPVTIPPMTMNFVFSDRIQGNSLLFDNNFDTPTLSFALFHQTTLNDLLRIKGLSLTLGLRLDYEKMWMNYNSVYDFSHKYSLYGLLTPMNMSVNMVPEQEFAVENMMKDKLSDDYFQLLPRFALKYDFNGGNVYASISRGYRSGGYNVQNVSELMRSLMTADMMTNVRDVTVPVLEQQRMVTPEVKEKIYGILNRMADAGEMNVADACQYKPESAWNYEVGTHLNFLNGRINLDGSLFLNDVRHLQLSRMTSSGLGRITINAGRSRTLGTEVAVRARITPSLMVSAGYGYTYATLRNYSDYDRDNNLIDCRGNYVPFMPKHTVNLDAAYTFRFTDSGEKISLKSLTLGTNYIGAGRIYWTELNDASQKYYSLLGGRVSADFGMLEVQAFARNLTSTHYNTFYFLSMNRGYEQHGKPFQLGVDVRIKL